MKIWQKLLLALAASAGFSVLAEVARLAGYFSPPRLRRKTSRKTIRSSGRVLLLARASAADMATTTSALSRSHLVYARTSNPDAKVLLAQLDEEVRSDCSYPDVSL